MASGVSLGVCGGCFCLFLCFGDPIPLYDPISLTVLYSLRGIYHLLIGKRGTQDERTAMMRILRVVGVLIGISLMAILIRQVGWPEVRQSLGMLGWGYILVITYPVTWMLLNTQGWRMGLHRPYAEKLGLRLLCEIRIAGETFNSLLPSGYVGGEPLKAHLLSRWIPVSEATSSVLIAKAAQSVALVFFVGFGLIVGGGKGKSILERPAELIALLCLSACIGLFVVLLAKGSFARVGRWLHRHTKHSALLKLEPILLELDHSIGAFYREGKGRFLASIAWHLGGWIVGAMEVFLIFWMIGHPINPLQAWFVGALAQLAAVIGLLSPMGIGLYEGGHYLAASALGIPPALGVSVALIRRVREIFWNIVGLWIFWRISKDKKKV